MSEQVINLGSGSNSLVHEARLLYDKGIYRDIYEINNINPKEWWGSILYLGMGMCYCPLEQSDKVTKTTIVEIDQRTVDFNKDIIKPEWTVICDDAYKFEPVEKYDFIFADIWWEQVESHVVDDLVERYKRYLNENGQVLYLKTVRK